MADDDDRLGGPWLMAAIRVEETADPTFFSPLCRVVTSINRHERALIERALDTITWGGKGRSFRRVKMKLDEGDVDYHRLMAAKPICWQPITDALAGGDIVPLLAELLSAREFEPADLDVLGTLFWRMRVERSKGQPKRSLRPSPSEARLELAAGYVRWLQQEPDPRWPKESNTLGRPLSRTDAIAYAAARVPSLNSKTGEIGGKLLAYLNGRRGSTRRKRR